MKPLRNHHVVNDHLARQGADPRAERAKLRSTRYGLTIVLAGITADDYLQWIRDPDPPAGTALKLISAQAAPTGERIELELLAQGEPPSNRAAAIAVGFPMTPEVIGIHHTPLRTPTDGAPKAQATRKRIELPAVRTAMSCP